MYSVASRVYSAACVLGFMCAWPHLSAASAWHDGRATGGMCAQIPSAYTQGHGAWYVRRECHGMLCAPRTLTRCVCAQIPSAYTQGRELPLNQYTELLRGECAMAGYTEVLTW